MHNKKRNCLDGCTASNSYTSSHDTGSPLFSEALAIIQKKFDIEKNAKNKVYAFILSHGLLNEFKEFSKHYSSDNPHSDCLDMIHLYASDND